MTIPFLFLFFSCIADYVCPSGSKLYNGACYTWNRSPKGQYSASDDCRRQTAGYLAAFHSRQDLDTLYSFVRLVAIFSVVRNIRSFSYITSKLYSGKVTVQLCRAQSLFYEKYCITCNQG